MEKSPKNLVERDLFLLQRDLLLHGVYTLRAEEEHPTHQKGGQPTS